MRTLSQLALALGTIVVPFALLAACAPEADEMPQVSASTAASDADNSDRNERDRSGETLTPLDQGGSEADREVTQRVRQSIVDQEGFSVDARNVKVITQDGVVTLRGPVASSEERTRIGILTAQASGVKRVDNQLEVAR